MNKAKLIDAIAHETKLSKADAKKSVNAIINIVTKQLKKPIKEAKITIPGFLTVLKVKRSARLGRNPQTGKEIKIPAKNVAKFKASSCLNSML